MNPHKWLFRRECLRTLAMIGRDYRAELQSLYAKLDEHGCLEGLCWPDRYYSGLEGKLSERSKE